MRDSTIARIEVLLLSASYAPATPLKRFLSALRISCSRALAFGSVIRFDESCRLMAESALARTACPFSAINFCTQLCTRTVSTAQVRGNEERTRDRKFAD